MPQTPDRSLSGTRSSLRAALETAVTRAWYPVGGGRGPAALAMYLALPLAWLYGAIVRRRAARREVPGFSVAARPDALVVVVGNITAGGTGKTPLLLEMARQLHAGGHSFAVLSRGYGGAHSARSSQPRFVYSGDSAQLVGDEPLAMARAIEAMTGDETGRVVISRERASGLQALLERGVDGAAIDVVLCDDGLQHYALPRDIEYAVIDAARGFGNGQLLPAGPLREPVARLALCDRVVCNAAAGAQRGQATRQTLRGIALRDEQVAKMSVDIASLQRLHGNGAGTHSEPGAAAAALLSECRTVLAVTALGNPQRFFDSLQAYLDREAPNTSLLNFAFADHHPFTLEDFMRIYSESGQQGSAVFIVTAKDAVKCEPFAAAIPLPCLVAEAGVSVPGQLLTPVLEGVEQLRQWRAGHA